MARAAGVSTLSPVSLSATNNLATTRHSGGWSLIEVSIAIAVIALIAAASVPTFSPQAQQKLDHASAAGAAAFRYARDQASLTRDVYGVSIETSNNRLRVFRLDMTTNPNTRVFDVYHPTSHQIYTVQFGSPPFDGVDLGTATLTFTASCDEASDLAFTPEGVTICIQPVATRIDGASIAFTANDRSSTLKIDNYSGRVVRQ